MILVAETFSRLYLEKLGQQWKFTWTSAKRLTQPSPRCTDKIQIGWVVWAGK